jgi:hypothetical protein
MRRIATTLFGMLILLPAFGAGGVGVPVFDLRATVIAGRSRSCPALP